MWRVQGFVLRALHRCYGNNPLRLPQTHHVEDEVINSSTILSTSHHSSDSSSQKGGDGEWRQKQRTFRHEFAELPRYTALDAVGWGVAASLFMQICRRIHSQFSSGTESGPTHGSPTAASILHKCGYRILLDTLSRRDVLPRGSRVLCLQGVPESQNQEQTSPQSSSSSTTGDAASHHSSGEDYLTADCSNCDQQRTPPSQDSPIPEDSLVSASCPLQNDGNRDGTESNNSNDQNALSDEEKLAEATLNLKHVGDNSIPVILNIIALEHAKSENYGEAFPYFVAAAQQGYSKAQFNVGVCYEKGRGVHKDTERAMHYYWHAAVGGHRQAQYRYAKLLLTTRGHHSLEELNTAINLLEESAAAGLTKAQLCLASVFTQEPVRNGSKSVQYLKMAAESGDSAALLFLGQCYQSGFGVQQNMRRAIDCYRRAARAGNKQAQILLSPLNPTGDKEDAVLRSIRSAPCFPEADRLLQQPLSSPGGPAPPSTGHPVALPVLPHSWSTGSLCVPVSLFSRPLQLHSTEEISCQWMVGIG
ncbi:death ligand signal enhancer isoform X2 [Brachionichthys hirsutus]|uniref:death ligand signal enhancer isoform X2 n=1 Tax=Brachionichthys hirsutus TaxID=412623 RepID=UPI003604CEFB